MGALVTLELPDDSPLLAMPWIVTFGPLSDDEDWEPVVCGPYERPHALALAEEVVADAELMAVVEPLLPLVSADDIRAEIDAARVAGAGVEDDLGEDLEYDEDDEITDDDIADDGHQAIPLPGPDEIRAGMARIALRLGDPG